jgi:hypothetical protein
MLPFCNDFFLQVAEAQNSVPQNFVGRSTSCTRAGAGVAEQREAVLPPHPLQCWISGKRAKPPSPDRLPHDIRRHEPWL